MPLSLKNPHLSIDSMPIEICRPSRAKRSRICSQHDESDLLISAIALPRKCIISGYKIHAVCTHQGVFKAFDLTKASTHDIHYLNDVREQFDHCILIGDKGYFEPGLGRLIYLSTPPSACVRRLT